MDPPLAIGNCSTVFLQLCRNRFDFVTLDKIADLNVIVVFKTHTAFIAFLDFLDVVFKALKLSERTVVNNHVVTQQTNLGAAFDHTFGNHAAGNLADTGNVKDIADFGITQNLFFQFRRQHAFQRFLNVIGHVIDNRIITNVNAVLTCHVAGMRNGTDVKADDKGVGSLGQRYVGIRNRTDGRMQNLNADFIV